MPAQALRRKPAQARSRARYEKVLAAARALIAEKGSDALKMSEIAERADVPIGSVYQFFPDKSAIIETLAGLYMEEVRGVLKEGAAAIRDRQSADRELDRLLDGYYAFFLNDPVVRDIWSGTQSDKRLEDMDVEDSRKNGEIFYAALRPLAPRAEWKRLKTSCFLMMQLTGAAVRFAIVLEPQEAARVMAEYKRLLRAQLLGALSP